MTIAAGFKCSDGIVLAADTEYTLNTVKIYGPKIFELPGAIHDPHVVLAGAGDVPFIQMTVELLDRELAKLQSVPQSSHQKAETAIRTTVANLHDGFLPPHPQPHEPSVDLLIAVWSADGGVKLWTSSSTAVAEVRDPPYRLLGYGLDLASCLIEPLKQEWATTVTASALAVYILKATKRFTQYCGGETDICILDANGNFRREDMDHIKAEEEFFSRLENSVSALLLPATVEIEEINDELIDVLIDGMKTEIKEWRKARRDEAERKRLWTERIAKLKAKQRKQT
jgi:20S proteasome alpha/beta subunit